jgi:hypothetical protein
MGIRDSMILDLSGRAFAGTATAFLAAVGAYWWSYSSHRKRVLESPGAEPSGGSEWLEAFEAHLVPQPRHLAVFSFIAKTLRRSQQHRLILTGFASLALALIVEGFLGISPNTRAYREASVAIPLALSLFLLFGLRYLFRLPVELRANWVFRIGTVRSCFGAWRHFCILRRWPRWRFYRRRSSWRCSDPVPGLPPER